MSLAMILLDSDVAHAQVTTLIQLIEAEDSFFAGEFDLAKTRVENALEDLRSPKTRRLFQQSGKDYTIQQAFARALRADILSALGDHELADDVIRAASKEAVKKRSEYIRRGVNIADLWLLEAYCHFFSGDIKYNRLRPVSFRIDPFSLATDRQKNVVIEFLGDGAFRQLRATENEYQNGLDVLENAFALGVTRNNEVDGVPNGQANGGGSSGDEGNGVSLTWNEILDPPLSDQNLRLSARCFIGLARSRMQELLLMTRNRWLEQKVITRLGKPVQEWRCAGDYTLVEVRDLLWTRMAVRCEFSHTDLSRAGVDPESIVLQLPADAPSVLTSIKESCDRVGLGADLVGVTLLISTPSIVSASLNEDRRLQSTRRWEELYDETESFFYRARELLKVRRQWKFFIDPQREWALSLKDVQADAMKNNAQGAIGRDNLTKLQAAYARTVIEWITLEQDIAEFSALSKDSDVGFDEERARQETTNDKYRKSIDLINENFSSNHPARFSLELSNVRFLVLRSNWLEERLDGVRNGAVELPDGLTEEQLVNQIDVLRSEAVQKLEDMLPVMNKKLSITHPLFDEAVCVLMECATFSKTAEGAREFLDRAERLMEEMEG